MTVEELLIAGSKNHWVFWALALIAVLSAWQPLVKIFVGIQWGLTAVYQRGVVGAIKNFSEQSQMEAKSLFENTETRNTRLLLQNSVSNIAAINSILPFMLVIIAITAMDYFGIEADTPGIVLLGLYTFIGAISMVLWLISAARNIVVYGKLIKLLKQPT